MVKGNKLRYKDGDRFPHIMNVGSEIISKDRWCPPKEILREMGAVKGDWVGWEKKSDNVYFISVVDPSKIKELDISLNGKQGKEILKELIATLPEGSEIECDHIVQIKSQGRMGAKNQLEKILSKLGAMNEDWLMFEFVDNDHDGIGWFINLIKNSDIIKRKYIEGDDEKTKTLAFAR